MRSLIEKILFLIALVVFLYSSYQLATYYMTMHQVKEEFHAIEEEAFPQHIVEEPVNVETNRSTTKKAKKKESTFQYHMLKKQNEDCIGWIRIEDTNINYPVMYQEGDNDFYLHRNFQKEYSIAGTPFLDGRCQPFKTGEHLIVYAHHMKDGSMFAGLEKYKKKEYYESHKEIQLYIENTLHRYEIFGTCIIQADKEYIFYELPEQGNQEAYQQYIQKVLKKMLYETGEEPEQEEPLLLLSTCEYSNEDGRMFVIAKKIS